jgi:hypothetical protein
MKLSIPVFQAWAKMARLGTGGAAAVLKFACDA